MNPTDIISVRLFKRHITEYLPEYSSIDDQNVLQTLQQLISLNVHDSALFLKKELQGNGVNFEEVLEEYVSDLAEYFVQNPTSSDSIIDQLLTNNFFSFASKVEEAKELQIVIHRNERKRLKELLVAHDEQQDAEDLRIAFERLERKELKKRLQEEEGSAHLVTSQRPSFSVGMMLRVAAILVVILIPAGIILFRNVSDSTSTGLAESDNQNEVNETQFVASEDISDLIQIDLPDELINNLDIPLLTSESSMGYAQELDVISVHLISNEQKGIYLKEKIEKLESKKRLMSDKHENDLKSGNIKSKGPESIEYQKTKEQLDLTIKECESLLTSIRKKENTYLFDNQSIDLFSSSLSKKDPFKVYERKNNEEDVSVEYYLLIKGNYYRIKKGISGQLIKVTNQEIIDELNDY
jgi:hypothetical protein